MRVAVTRHCGTVQTVYTTTGPVTVQRGKDLSRIDAVIGTGGAAFVINLQHACGDCGFANILPQRIIAVEFEFKRNQCGNGAGGGFADMLYGD